MVSVSGVVVDDDEAVESDGDVVPDELVTGADELEPGVAVPPVPSAVGSWPVEVPFEDVLLSEATAGSSGEKHPEAKATAKVRSSLAEARIAGVFVPYASRSKALCEAGWGPSVARKRAGCSAGGGLQSRFRVKS